jgi:hypothetical protein
LISFQQWGLQSASSSTKIILPITAKFIRGVSCDGGNWYNSCGIDADGKFHCSSEMAVSFIVITYI